MLTKIPPTTENFIVKENSQQVQSQMKMQQNLSQLQSQSQSQIDVLGNFSTQRMALKTVVFDHFFMLCRYEHAFITN